MLYEIPLLMPINYRHRWFKIIPLNPFLRSSAQSTYLISGTEIWGIANFGSFKITIVEHRMPSKFILWPSAAFTSTHHMFEKSNLASLFSLNSLCSSTWCWQWFLVLGFWLLLSSVSLSGKNCRNNKCLWFWFKLELFLALSCHTHVFWYLVPNS